MKTQILTLAFLFLVYGVNAQILNKVKDAAQRTAERKIEQKTEQKTGEAIDSVFSGNKKQKKQKKSEVPSIPQANDKGNPTKNDPKAVKANSDFVPGDRVIFTDNFAQDGNGDFPAQWNTNGSGEVTTIDQLDGKWLNISHNSVVTPEMSKTLPENCTIEFDLFLQDNGNGNIPLIHFGLTPVQNILKEDLYYREKFYVAIGRYNEPDAQFVEYGLRELIGNKNNFPLTSYKNKVLHVSMSINGTRIRVYFDNEKLIDLPKALTPSMHNNLFINNVYTIPASEQGILISNIRIAEAGTDARSQVSKQIMEEGKFSTNEILFDVNKDVIKPSSFAVLNEVGETMQQNQSLKIKIVGHTDSDGDENANQLLSEKRAVAVKNYLQQNYSIAPNRMATVGMGESQPVSTNATSEGKAKNRRVEFIKL